MNKTNPLFPQREIRSFVRRQGRLSDAQHYALAHFWEKYGLRLEQGVLNLDTVFNRQAPRVLEIGFGMGQSLITQARQHPEQDYLGIEVHKPGIANVLVAIEQQLFTNIRVFNADAVEALKRSIADESFDLAQLFFPDPWPKRRHHKRRIVQPEFVELVRRKLKPGGRFHLATDWQDYAEHMMQVLTAVPGFINAITPGQFSPRPLERPLTKFELRGQNLGHEIWDLIFIKT